MPKISVIVPVYNAEEYLYESIPSLLNQTLQDIEIICVNDGSTDNSLAILNNFSKKNSKIKVINKKNGGCGSARNMAMDNATGEYLFFFDPDDYIVKHAFEELYVNAKNNKSDIVLTQVARYTEGNSIDYTNPGFDFEKIFKDVDFENYIFHYKKIKKYVLNASFAPWTKLYRRSFIEQYRFRFNVGLAFDDVPFHVKTMLKAQRLSFIPKAFYHYRLSNENSVNHTVSNAKDIFDICDILENFLVCNNYFSEFKDEFLLFKITQILQYLLFSRSEDYFRRAKNEFQKMDISDNFLPNNLQSRYTLVKNSNSLKNYKNKGIG